MTADATSRLPGMAARTAPGHHASVVYADDDAWAGHLTAFVRTGLAEGARVWYFADTTAPEHVLRTLMDRDVDAVTAVRRGQLTVTTADETYLSGRCFDPDVLITLWHDAVGTALAAGYRRLHTIGEMAWAARGTAGADRLLEYELRVHHEVLDRLPLTAWCLYDRRLMPPDDLAVLAEAHPTRLGTALPAETPATCLRVGPLTDRPGFRLSGSAGYESRRVTASVAAALASSATDGVTLDLGGLRHLDTGTLVALADAAARRPSATPLHVTGAPLSAERILGLFPELRTALEVVAR
ncbi:MEDS domain-containing protein [Streptomyces sp. enrichment culture]|uniref:MEDS domain-containing protein n=1 Tax=Streptomyces sp. enrichment culture TaxID=1795815 RepID=UPI003F54D5CE